MQSRFKRPVEIREESLERLIERMEYRQAIEEDDLEAELDELIDELADVQEGPFTSAGGYGPNEFVCRMCHLIEHRSRLADQDDTVCVDCARTLAGTV
jgi:hypothetical protein